MARPFALAFYDSKEWEKCRLGYLRSKYFVCERCGGAAKIVHHKKYITPKNINDPKITLDWKNLEALCLDCHNKEHMTRGCTSTETMFDKNGDLIRR